MGASEKIKIDMANIRNNHPAELRIDWDQFTNWFNATLQMYGSSIAPLKYITKGKRVQAQRIVNELGTKQVLIDAVVAMAKSDLCNGRCRTKLDGWKASFPWMLSKDEIMADLANGKYDNPPTAELTPEEQRQLEQEAYRAQQEARRAEARRIEEEEREKQRARRQREYEEWLRQRPSAADLKKILGENYLLDK